MPALACRQVQSASSTVGGARPEWQHSLGRLSFSVVSWFLFWLAALHPGDLWRPSLGQLSLYKSLASGLHSCVGSVGTGHSSVRGSIRCRENFQTRRESLGLAISLDIFLFGYEIRDGQAAFCPPRQTLSVLAVACSTMHCWNS